MRRLLWIALSALAYAIACVESFRADAAGLRHTDPPCARVPVLQVGAAARRVPPGRGEVRLTPLGTVDDLLEGRARAHVHEGDALRFLASLPSRVVDAVVTDPPYSSGGAFRGDRVLAPERKYQQSGREDLHETFDGDGRDARSWAYWAHLWLSEAFRVARPGAPLCVFTDWRQLPATTDVVQGAGWIWRGVVPWDKTEGCRPQLGRFRAQCEYIVWGSRGPMPLDRDAPVLAGAFRRQPHDKEHMTEKPLELLRSVVQICERGGLVLDPFAGSGSTGHAALLEGRRALLCESHPGWADYARARLDFDAPTGDGQQLGLGELSP